MATILDIAQILNVNKSTVSKALNNSPDINPTTAKKIRALAKEMGYEKRPRKSLKEKTIGIITSEIDDAYYSQLANGVISVAEASGYSCCILTSNFDACLEEKAVRFLIEKNVSGVLLVVGRPLQLPSLIERFSERNIPVVSISERNFDYKADNIWIDDNSGVDDAIEHFYSLGHREIAYIGDKYGMGRLAHYKKSMQDRNLQVLESLTVLLNERSYDCGYKGAKKLIESGEKFTAIFAQYDDIAVGAMRALKELGVMVPEDVSIIGADDARYCPYLSPALTSINSNTESLCAIAFKLLKNKIEGKEKTIQSVFVKPKLEVRETTANAKCFET